jgi:hypothetical protein
MIPAPSSYSYRPVAVYDPNQWRQNQQTNFQIQPESSVANSNPQGNNKQDNSPSTSMASKGRIMTIIGGNSIDHENNNQKKNYFRRVNSISTEGPYKKTRWSHLPITFLEKDLQLKDYPHMDAMVVEANIDGWVVSKILVDGGSSTDTIFTTTIDAMKIDRKLLGRAEHPLYGFGGNPIHLIGRIILLVSFWNSKQCKNRANYI